MLRSRSLGSLSLGVCLLASMFGRAAAQDEQIIEDPELADVPVSSSGTQVTSASESGSGGSGGSSDGGGSGSARAVLHTRFAADFRHESDREEIYDNISIGLLEASVRRSESLRFALGLRARYRFASFGDDVREAEAERYELDAVPTAGYADWLITDGLHLQAGYQTLHLGRFDVLSATNFLEVADLRDGPATLPESSAIAQLSVRVDYDFSSWLSLRAIYVPFFRPHRISLVEGDYAPFPVSDEGIDRAVAGLTNQAVVQRRFIRTLYANVSRADRERLGEAAMGMFVPEPTFAHPQGALRLSAHGPAGELALTVGTALEHLPTLDPSISFLEAAAFPDDMATAGRLASELHPVRVRFDRFAVFSIDGAADVGPLSVGAELAYMPNRTFYAMNDDASVGCGSPDGVMDGTTAGCPRVGHSDLVQGGLRVEYVRTTEWVATLEGFLAYALHDPASRYPGDDRDMPVSRSWSGLENGHVMWGAAALVRFAPDAFPIELELSSGVFNGPSVVLMPRIGYGVLENLDVEIGALFVEGEDNPAATAASPSNVALGSLYDSVDQIYVGVRYLP